jgi:Inner membrane component of T3SS, cytoplasmic domain
MDAAAHYRHLLSLGRTEFLAAAAPAMLVRYRLRTSERKSAPVATQTLGAEDLETLDQDAGQARLSSGRTDLELYPLSKKPGASFPDRITIGRTTNNDVVISDHSVSRLHAYARQVDGGWVVADAGSKNGSWLGNDVLEARREVALVQGAAVRFGDVRLTFYRAAELYDLLGGTHVGC